NCPIIGDVYTRSGRFVGRVSDRWSLLSSFEPARTGERRYRGVVLSGAPELGKSWLVKRSGRDFPEGRYVVPGAQLSAADTRAGRASIDVLTDWRGRPGNKPPLGPLPGFEAFDKACANNESITAIFDAFKAGLQNARAGRKIVLILDNFRKPGSIWVRNSSFRE